MADQQGTVEEKLPIATASAGSVREILLRITRWQVMIDKRLNSQMTLLEALEHFALTELRRHYPDGHFAPGFVVALLDAILQSLSTAGQSCSWRSRTRHFAGLGAPIPVCRPAVMSM